MFDRKLTVPKLNTAQLHPMRYSAVAVALLLAACRGASPAQPLTAVVRGVTYEIPKTGVDAAALNPPDMLFVRARPPNARFDLILDAFSPYLADKLGPNVPTVSRINSNRFGRFRVIETADGPVICDLGPGLHYQCGLSINDGPVKWGVLFDKAQVALAQSIRRQAQAAIDRYRTEANPSRRI